MLRVLAVGCIALGAGWAAINVLRDVLTYGDREAWTGALLAALVLATIGVVLWLIDRRRTT